MTDLALETFDDGTVDLVLFGGELLLDDSLRPAVAVSLLTDREYAEAEDGDRRGWWGDALNADPQDRIGSWLWRLNRRKRELPVLAEAKQYAEGALAWLVKDAIATSVVASASWDANGQLQVDVVIQRPSGTQRFRLAELWQASLDKSALAKAEEAAGDYSGTAALYEYIYYTQYPEMALP